MGVVVLNGLVACIPNVFASLTGHTEQARTVLMCLNVRVSVVLWEAACGRIVGGILLFPRMPLRFI